jgi:hypothetical protein
MPHQPQEPPNPIPVLNRMGREILAHWQRFRPRMCSQMTQAELRRAVYAAQELTQEAMYDLEIRQKMPADRAREMVYPQWFLLPSETDQPELGFDPLTLHEQLPETTESPTPPKSA